MVRINFPHHEWDRSIDCEKKSDLSGLLRYQESEVSIFGKIDLTPRIKSLEDRVRSLESQLALQKEKIQEARILPDEEAEKEIEFFLNNRKKRGIAVVNIIDLMQELNLPPPQIEKIMTKLKSKGVKLLHE